MAIEQLIDNAAAMLLLIDDVVPQRLVRLTPGILHAAKVSTQACGERVDVPDALYGLGGIEHRHITGLRCREFSLQLGNTTLQAGDALASIGIETRLKPFDFTLHDREPGRRGRHDAIVQTANEVDGRLQRIGGVDAATAFDDQRTTDPQPKLLAGKLRQAGRVDLVLFIVGVRRQHCGEGVQGIIHQHAIMRFFEERLQAGYHQRRATRGQQNPRWMLSSGSDVVVRARLVHALMPLPAQVFAVTLVVRSSSTNAAA